MSVIRSLILQCAVASGSIGVWLAFQAEKRALAGILIFLALCGLAIWFVWHRRSSTQADEPRFRAIADTAPVMIWVSDPRNRRRYFNESWLRFRGRTVAEEMDSGWLEGVHPEDVEHYCRVVDEAMREKRRFQIEYRLQHHSRTYRWVVSTGVPRFTTTGRLTGYVGTCVDVHERRENEEAVKKSEESFRSLTGQLERLAMDLARANAELEEQNRRIARAARQKTMFLSTMSHELQTPLNAICGFADLLAEERAGVLNDKQRKYVAHIRNGANHLLRVISDILDLSRIETGHLQLERSHFDAREAIEETVAGMMSLASQRNIRLRTASGDDGEVYADRTRFAQILYNLISNSIKYTPAGGSVTVERKCLADHWEFAVQDSGVGIPEEQQEAIFSEFHQVDSSATGARKGTGLGLAITKSLVECHGGTISVQSKPGEGSRFIFTMPAIQTAALETNDCIAYEPASK